MAMKLKDAYLLEEKLWHLFRDYHFFRIQRVPLTIFVVQTCLKPVIMQLNITVDFEGGSYTLRTLPYKEI